MHGIFHIELCNKIISSIKNDYQDNFDFTRFDREDVEKSSSLLAKIISFFKTYLASKNYINEVILPQYIEQLKNNSYKFSNFVYLYENLELQSNRTLLVDIAAYRLMG